MRKHHYRNLWIAAAAALTAQAWRPATAAVLDSGANGFTIQQTAHLTQPSAKVYAALIQPKDWWSGEHTYSGSAANLTFGARAGGCWCETLPDGGSVAHMTVVYAAPGKALRLRGGLGPLQEMGASGTLTWTLKPAGNETDLTLTYAVAGYAKDGYTELAKTVDRVLSEQVGRLTLYVDTGMPEPQP